MTTAAVPTRASWVPPPATMVTMATMAVVAVASKVAPMTSAAAVLVTKAAASTTWAVLVTLELWAAPWGVTHRGQGMATQHRPPDRGNMVRVLAQVLLHACNSLSHTLCRSLSTSGDCLAWCYSLLTLSCSSSLTIVLLDKVADVSCVKL